MNLAELRDTLKKYQVDELRQIIVEMYRASPKKIRDEKHFDDIVQDIDYFLQTGKALSKIEPPIDLDQLKSSIEVFIDYAKNQYYFAPNTVVHKKDRPKWRHIVRNYINDLQKIPMDGEKGILATDLLDQLFRVLGHASHHYLFNTNDPFRSIGIQQDELMNIILIRRMKSGSLSDAVKKSVAMAVETYADMYTSQMGLIHSLINHLTSVDARTIALQHGLELKSKLNIAQMVKNKSSHSSNSDYYKTEQYNCLISLICSMKIFLGDNLDAIRYYHENFRGSSEKRIYELLRLLKYHELDDLYRKESESALKKGIKIRETPKIVYVSD